MASIVLYFVKQNNARRVLDTDFEKEGHIWRIGRARDVDINFDQQLVSKYHAQIRATFSEGEFNAHWEVRDTKSTNGTFLNGKRMESGIWYPILDKDVLIFGTNENIIKLSFDDDDTQNLMALDLEIEQDNGPDTISKPCVPDAVSIPPPSFVKPERNTWQGETLDELNEVSLPRLMIYATISVIALVIVLIFWH
jgi:pSer/pThr/pTyr-binding forkhead associated (FHA) protein